MNIVNKVFSRFVCAVALLMLFGTANSIAQPLSNTASQQEVEMSDPLEPVNRWLWDFNYQVLDTYIYRPVTQSYVDWVPRPGRVAINNAVLNLEEPSTMVNNLIQLEFKHAADALFRFSFNSTFGVFGLIDVAEMGGVYRRRESFSNVLGRWHVPHGPYIMMPIIGPRSTRLLVGNIVDGLYFPGSYFNFWQTTTVWALDGLDVREGLLGQEILVDQSLDSYTLVKKAYMQYEAFKFYSNSESMQEFIDLKREQEQLRRDEELGDFMDEID